MTKYKYPPGAVMDMDEIQEAITNETILYSVVEDLGSSIIDNLVPFIPVRTQKITDRDGFYCLYFKERQTGREGDISLDWRGIPHGGCAPGGHLFTNYWHAYAYKLKIEQAQDA